MFMTYDFRVFGSVANSRNLCKEIKSLLGHLKIYCHVLGLKCTKRGDNGWHHP